MTTHNQRAPSLDVRDDTVARGTRSKPRAGVAAVEFAIVLPFLVFAFLVAADYARIYYYAIIVDHSAREGAIYAGKGSYQSTDTTGIKNAAKDDAAGIASKLTVNPITYFKDSNNNDCVSVKCSYTYQTVAQFPGIPSSVALSASSATRIAK